MLSLLYSTLFLLTSSQFKRTIKAIKTFIKIKNKVKATETMVPIRLSIKTRNSTKPASCSIVEIRNQTGRTGFSKVRERLTKSMDLVAHLWGKFWKRDQRDVEEVERLVRVMGNMGKATHSCVVANCHYVCCCFYFLFLVLFSFSV